MQDYYRILGVPYGASQNTLRQAFRSKAKKFHPDVQAKAPPSQKAAMNAKFIQLAQAYHVLSDPDRRKVYDLQWMEQKRKKDAQKKAQEKAQQQAQRESFKKAASSAYTSASKEDTQEVNVEDLVDEVQKMFHQFGVELEGRFLGTMDKVLSWALDLFLSTLDPKAEKTSTPPPKREKPNWQAGEQTASGRRKKEPPPDFEAELAALKAQVRRSGPKAPNQESLNKQAQRFTPNKG